MRLISNLKFKISNSEGGQALITLLFFMVIGVTVVTATVLVLFINNLSASISQQGTAVYYLAESGAEDGYLHLLRNPNYTVSHQIYTVNSGQVDLSIDSSRMITSIGTIGNSIRKIQVQTVYNNGAFTISSWKEIN